MTQVLLLHIPPSSLKFLSELDVAIAFIQDSLGDKMRLVDIARKSLDEKLTQDVHPRSLDPEFCKRMHWPVGVDEKGTPFSLDICPIVEDDELQKLSDLIHYLANDVRCFCRLLFRSRETNSSTWGGRHGVRRLHLRQWHS